jgi:hypothetical protein
MDFVPQIGRDLLIHFVAVPIINKPFLALIFRHQLVDFFKPSFAAQGAVERELVTLWDQGKERFGGGERAVGKDRVVEDRKRVPQPQSIQDRFRRVGIGS